MRNTDGKNEPYAGAGRNEDSLLLNKELSQLKEAIDQSFIIAITDHRGIIEEVNRKFCELSQYSREELIGRDHRILNSGYHPKEFFQELWRTIGAGETWRGEIRNRAKDGSLYWVHTTIVPVLNEKGRPFRYISMRVEITEQKETEAALQKALKDDFSQMVKSLENGIFKVVRAKDGNFVYKMSEGKLMEKLGLNTEAIKDRTPYSLFAEPLASYKHSQYQKAFRGSRVNYEFSLDGRLIYVDVSPIRQNGEVVELVGSVHDRTDFRSTQRQLEENQLLYESLFKHSQDAVFTLDLNGILMTLNPAAEVLFGYAFEVPQEKAISFVAKPYQETARLCFRNALLGELQNFDTAILGPGGEEIHLNLTLLPIVFDQEITGIYAIGKDITEHKKAQEMNAYLAQHDELTKLLNRRGFEAQLKEALLDCGKLAVMYIDLDRFKNINDTLGHYIGDRLLEAIAHRLKLHAGDQDFIARMGGDEFMILCPMIHGEEEVLSLTKDLLRSMNEPFFIKEFELYVTASIGISFFPEHGDNVVELMKHADVALYKAKDEGRSNFQIYSPSMDESSYHSFFMERDLRKALNQQEFMVYFQPRVDVESNELAGAEALIRWNHPEYGIVSPREFIPLAEETGLIIPIGRYVKRSVCEQLVKWRQAGLPLITVSINISAQRFLQKDFAHSFRQLLEEYSLDGRLLEIEITENSLMKNEEYVKHTIDELKKLGIKIFIDDFGTGYSSFSYLNTYKLDGLKIDKSFIRNISAQSENASITSAMIKMAQLLKMEIIAEGVETEEELQFLRDHDCRQVQGYFFGKPVCAEEFEKRLRRKKI